MDDKILIVGGYGNVGRMIALELVDLFPGRVIVAGRNYDKAAKLAESTGMKALPMRLDVGNAGEGHTLPDDIRLVIMCLDLPDIIFVKNCLMRGIHYIDITANYGLLFRIESLDSEAKENDATAVLSVGLAPGLTNLLAAQCKSRLGRIERADIFILLGLGEAHGEAAIRWTIENLNRTFSVQENGIARQVESLGEGKRTTFPEGINKRTAYRFNFSDQWALPRTLGIPSVSTWLCFDPALMTTLFALCKKTGLLGMLRFKAVRELMVRIFKTLHFGSDIYVVKIDAEGRETSCECAVSGHGEARCTALIASQVAARLFAGSFPPGVFHIEQLFDPVQMIAVLEEKGMKYYSI
jgi:saccharopine dehydrogenase (NAD+, L-lysine forming)